ncbi:MAG: hypothetical protein ABFC94_12500 [Syntrophomonas sp.]
MKKEEIRRYLPVGLFASLTSIIIIDVGSALNLWTLKQNIFPLGKIFPYHLGMGPVVTMWLFKFTYGKFWRFLTVDTILNLLFAFLLIPFIDRRGIRATFVSYWIPFWIAAIQGLVIYLYQVILDGVPVIFKAYNLDPAVMKPKFNKVIKNKRRIP